VFLSGREHRFLIYNGNIAVYVLRNKMYTLNDKWGVPTVKNIYQHKKTASSGVGEAVFYGSSDKLPKES
jgi:hypothetical protein